MRKVCTQRNPGVKPSENRYPEHVEQEPASPSPEETQRQVGALKRMLDAEIDRQLGPQRGCWPLLVAVAGLLLGLALLAGLL